MLLVGLTGGIGSGKSTVARLLVDSGIELIDSDVVAREVVAPQTKAWFLLKQHFGEKIIQSDGTIDRTKLAAIVFNDSSERRVLNGIVHPEIYKSIAKRLLWLFLTGERVVVLDLPLLYETGYLSRIIAKVIVVYCTKQQQRERIICRNNYSETEANQRIESQLSLDEKRRLAEFVVDNSGDLAETKKQVHIIISQLLSSNEVWKYRAIFWGTLAILSGALVFSTHKIFAILKSFC